MSSPYDPQPLKGQAPQLWPEGNYVGTFVSWAHASTRDGMPRIALHFDIRGAVKIVSLPISEKDAEWVGRTLAVLNMSGTYDEPVFNPPATVPLYCKHKTWGEKLQEQWSISASGGDIAPDQKAIAERAWAAMKRHGTTPAIPPPSASKGPPPPPASTGPPPPVNPLLVASTMDEAWNYLAAKGVDGPGFWKIVSIVGDGMEGAPDVIAKSFTAEMWNAAATNAVPF